MLNSNQSWFFHQYENTFPVNFSTSDLITLPQMEEPHNCLVVDRIYTYI